MAQSMLMSGVNGVASGRSLLQAARPSSASTPFSRLALSSSSSAAYYKHMPSLSVRTMALFGKKTKAAPAKKVAAPKPKTEDGIFGTSGGIGFTKENELFVGRVAMIGFAASILGEAITGKGILSQLNLETGIPIYEAEPLLLFFILFTLLGAIGALGDRGRFVDEQPTGLDKAVIAPGKGFRSALGLSEGGPLFGFTKSNELFVGRLAQLGIAFSIIEIEPLVLFNVVFFFIAAINPGTGKFISGEEDD
ncbi:unnamed protein product [Triticum turgidum subsp. durum]|uniref:Uncharacterized protein n=1 Tax=Triticum turgidum subsp. durum TaxID=4567 RepID=A0A9R0VPR2_TRITD|nr:unnamed protein product [Triticum turgidum subsp. durum]